MNTAVNRPQGGKLTLKYLLDLLQEDGIISPQQVAKLNSHLRKEDLEKYHPLTLVADEGLQSVGTVNVPAPEAIRVSPFGGVALVASPLSDSVTSASSWLLTPAGLPAKPVNGMSRSRPARNRRTSTPSNGPSGRKNSVPARFC